MTPANSVAYCALRDPIKNIYRLFPDATSYRSIVHKIDKSAQKQVKNKVPFSIHNDELGQHTLYVAMKGKMPLGIIHSRSEVGLWGLIEIVWAFDFELNVVDFMFQRCRESACKLIEAPSFRQLLWQQSADQLSQMLEQDTISYPENIKNNQDAKVLAETMIQSAIKTALVTDIAWHNELQSFIKVMKVAK